MAKYIKQEMNNLDGSEKRRQFYRMKIERNISMDEFIDEICHPGSGLSRGTVIQVLTMTADRLARTMAQGHSVSIEGIGTFKPKLGVIKEREAEHEEEENPNFNARSIEVNNINYRADKELIQKTNRLCELSRGGVSRIHKSPYSQEQRIERALLFLQEHPFLCIRDYMAINQMKRTSAALELQRLSSDPTSGLTIEGRGSHRVYVKREEK